MRVLITGGAGFIGSNLADRLIIRGDEVFVIDNLFTGLMKNVNPDLSEFFMDSIVSEESCEKAFSRSKPEVVVHAAATGKDPHDWKTDALSNVVGTINVVRNSQKVGVKRIIYLQTSLCYGTPLERPITLSHPINPTNSYSITKTAGERFVAVSSLDFVSFRLANCYGPRNLAGAIPTFYKRLTAGDPCFVYDTKRDFVYVDDLIDVMVKAIDLEGESGYYHVSTGSEYSLKMLFDVICNALSMEVNVEVKEMIEEDVPSILLDPSKTIEEFGFIPKVPLSVGITEALEWYRENGVENVYTHLPLPKKHL